MKYSAIFVILTAIYFVKELYWMFWSQSWITFTTAKKVAVVLKTEKILIFTVFTTVKGVTQEWLQNGQYMLLPIKW